MTLLEGTDASAIFARLNKAINGLNLKYDSRLEHTRNDGNPMLLYVDEILTIYPCTEAATSAETGIRTKRLNHKPQPFTIEIHRNTGATGISLRQKTFIVGEGSRGE
jgi:hypothetical protein